MWLKLHNIGATSNEANFNHSSSEVDVDDFNEYCILPELPSSVDSPVDFSTFAPFQGFSFRSTDSLEVFDAILQIKWESTGADGVPLKFIKLIFPIISDQIVHILNAVITTSTFPLQWKIGRVIPIPKTRHVENFRNVNERANAPLLGYRAVVPKVWVATHQWAARKY